MCRVCLFLMQVSWNNRFSLLALNSAHVIGNWLRLNQACRSTRYVKLAQKLAISVSSSRATHACQLSYLCSFIFENIWQAATFLWNNGLEVKTYAKGLSWELFPQFSCRTNILLSCNQLANGFPWMNDFPVIGSKELKTAHWPHPFRRLSRALFYSSSFLDTRRDVVWKRSFPK